MGRPTLVLPLLFALVGCSGGSEECAGLEDGEWTFDGPAIGMTMGGTVKMDLVDCTFAISEWSMAMTHLPSGGEVVGHEVTLSGDEPYWETCVGELDDDGKSATGICSEDDAGFTMDAGAP